MKNFTILALVTALALPALAASPDAQPAPAPAAKEGKELPACCKAKMEQKAKLEKDMTAMDAKVDELVKALKDAGADKKVAALETLVVELATQRKTLTDMVTKCQMGMGHEGCVMGEHKGATAEAGKAGCSHMKAAKS